MLAHNDNGVYQETLVINSNLFDGSPTLTGKVIDVLPAIAAKSGSLSSLQLLIC